MAKKYHNTKEDRKDRQKIKELNEEIEKEREIIKELEKLKKKSQTTT